MWMIAGCISSNVFYPIEYMFVIIFFKIIQIAVYFNFYIVFCIKIQPVFTFEKYFQDFS